MNKIKDPGMQASIEVICGKWNALILWTLKAKAKRFSDIKEEVEGITQKMLSQQLKDLQRLNIVSRKSYPEIPPRVEYKLTEQGRTLLPILEMMNRWGEDYLGITKKKANVKESKQLGLF